MNILIFGPNGSGKGTQADLIQQSYGFPKISTGDLLRKEVDLGTDLGKKVSQEMKAGRLVSDELVLELVEYSAGRVVSLMACTVIEGVTGMEPE